MKQIAQLLILILIPCMSLLLSCSPKGELKVLSFFFDGVNDSVHQDSSPRSDSTLLPDTAPGIIPANPATRADYQYHQPYSKQQCTACHDKSSRSRLIQSQPALCYSCHKGLQQKFVVAHGPFDSGNCTQCHAPHLSPFPKLLKWKDPDLCLQCHNSRDIKNIQAHQENENKLCLDCHLPHGGDKQHLLR